MYDKKIDTNADATRNQTDSISAKSTCSTVESGGDFRPNNLEKTRRAL